MNAIHRDDRGRIALILSQPVRSQLWIMFVLAAALSGCSAQDVQSTGDSGVAGDVSGPVRFSEHLIMGDYAYPYGIWASDLDVAAVAEHGSYEFRWWRNEGRSPVKSD